MLSGRIAHVCGGTHISLFTVKPLPVLSPETYTPDLLGLIVPRILEPTYTPHGHCRTKDRCLAAFDRFAGIAAP